MPSYSQGPYAVTKIRTSKDTWFKIRGLHASPVSGGILVTFQIRGAKDRYSNPDHNTTYREFNLKPCIGLLMTNETGSNPTMKDVSMFHQGHPANLDNDHSFDLNGQKSEVSSDRVIGFPIDIPVPNRWRTISYMFRLNWSTPKLDAGGDHNMDYVNDIEFGDLKLYSEEIKNCRIRLRCYDTRKNPLTGIPVVRRQYKDTELSNFFNINNQWQPSGYMSGYPSYLETVSDPVGGSLYDHQAMYDIEVRHKMPRYHCDITIKPTSMIAYIEQDVPKSVQLADYTIGFRYKDNGVIKRGTKDFSDVGVLIPHSEVAKSFYTMAGTGKDTYPAIGDTEYIGFKHNNIMHTKSASNPTVSEDFELITEGTEVDPFIRTSLNLQQYLGV